MDRQTHDPFPLENKADFFFFKFSTIGHYFQSLRAIEQVE